MVEDLNEWEVRYLCRKDIDDLVAIELASFLCPWTQEDFLRGMANRQTVSKGIFCRGILAGYAIWTMNNDFGHLTNLAVGPDWRRSKVGTMLLHSLAVTLGKRRDVYVEVVETNLVAQMFFKSLGFRCTATIHNYYCCTDDAALQMCCSVDNVAARITSLHGERKPR